jgi:hypothetical protein
MAITSGSYQCISWSEDPDCVEYWDRTEFTWSDCILIAASLPPATFGGAAPKDERIPKRWVSGSLDDLCDADKKRKKRLIQLVTYVKDDVMIDEKEVQDVTLTVDDIYLVKNEMEKRLHIKLDKI